MNGDVLYMYKKHKKILSKFEDAKYRSTDNYKFKFKSRDLDNVDFVLKNVRYFSSDSYKKELGDLVTNNLSDLIDSLNVLYGLKIDEISIKFDEKSYDK